MAVAIKHLVALGMTGEALAAAVAEMEAAQDTRSTGAKRQARYRERLEERNKASQSVTRDDSVTPPPLLDKKEKSPHTPLKEKINHSPRVCDARALARKAGGFGPPEGVDLETWNGFAAQRRKPITKLAYARICNRLVECAEAGWPPGEMVARAIERGWETVFLPDTPKANRNGNHGSSSFDRSEPQNPMVRAAIAAELRRKNQGGDGDGPGIPSLAF